MSKIKFWEGWDTNIKYPYLFLFLLTFLALLLGVFHYFTGASYAYDWDKITDLQVVPVPVNEVSRLLETFTLRVDGYLVFEQYDVALPKINNTAANLFLGLIAISLVFYTAAISTMKRFSYFGGVLLLMLFLATFNFDLLGVLGNGASQATLLLSIAFLAMSSYAFQAFWQQTTFALRVAVMMLVMSLLGLLIYSGADFPAELVTLHLANYSSIGTFVITLLFMLWVGAENISALLWVNTQAKTPEKRFGLWQFVLISLLYLLNLLLLYLRHIGYLQANLFFVNGYFIFLLSVIAGFWGMKQREAFYKNLFLFKPTGAVLYLVFATIAFSSIGYAFATANDSLTVLYHDLIVYTHLAFGFVFFLYVIMNFSALIQQRLAVYKVVYEPKRMTLFTFFLMSLMLFTVFVMRSQYRAYYYAISGYYNYLGDLYTASGNDILAQRFYEESNVFDGSNVKANYNLASIYRQKNQQNSEIVHLKEALVKRPEPKLYIRLANLYDEKQYFFEKLYVLQEGIAKFPKSAEIYNNLALMYARTSVQDSTSYYFNLAQKYTSDEDFIQSNMLAYYTRQAMLDPAKELLHSSRKGKYKTLRSNAAVLKQLLGLDTKERTAFMPDSLNEIEDLTLFYNQSLGSLTTGDTTRLNYINGYLATPANSIFYEDLLYLKALLHHYSGKPREARRVMESLSVQAENKSGYYYHALGLWMMEEKNYKASASYFKKAKDAGYQEAFLAEGYALALAHQPQQAIEVLQEVAYTENEAAISAAQDLMAILEQDVIKITAEAPDTDKVKFLMTYYPSLSLEEVNNLVEAVQEKDLKRKVLLVRIDYLMENRRWKLALEAIEDASRKLKPEGELRSALNLQQLRLWLNTENYATLLNRMNRLYLTERDKRQLLYFKAKVAEAKGRKQEAVARYEQAVDMLLYDEEVLLAAANFFDKYQPATEKAYNILLSGIIYNPYSAELYKAYALESLDQGLFSYAEQAQQTLQDLLPATEYTTFIKKLDKKRQAKEAKADNWQL